MLGRWAVVTAAVVAWAGAAWGQPTKPASRPATRPGEKVWELNKFLHGTAGEVRDQLNGELDRLLAKKAESETRIKQYAALLARRKAEAEAAVRKSPAHVKASADLRKAEADLAQARKTGTPTEKIEASGRFNRLRLSVEKMERDAVNNDEEVKGVGALLEAERKGMPRLDESIETARRWRGELLGAIRNGHRLSWPLRSGAAGILVDCTVLDVIDGEGIILSYEAPERIATEGRQEGVTTIRYVPHRVRVVLPATDTKPFQKGATMHFCRNFEVAGSKFIGDDVVYFVRPVHADIDTLLDTIDPPGRY